MKKLLLVLAVAAFVACNDSGTAEETPNSDTAATQPSTPPPSQDTTGTSTDTTQTGDTSALKK